MTHGIADTMYRENDFPDLPIPPDPAGWREQDKGMIVYGRYDIWQVDPEGIRSPVNLTHGYGRENHIVFRILRFNEEPHTSFIRENDHLILFALNSITKEQGFFRLDMKTLQLTELTMSPHLYIMQSNDFCGAHDPGHILKAERSRSLFFIQNERYELSKFVHHKRFS